jgi:hypothetical protein
MKTPKVKKATVGRSRAKVTRSSKTKEEKAEISRENGRKSAAVIARFAAYPKSDPMPVIQTDLADMFADIYNPKAKYAPELKIQVAACYMMTGTVGGAARLTGLDHRLISDWKNNSEWWFPVLQKVRKEKQDELDAELTDILHQSTAQLKERLENGDTIFVGKDAEPVQRPLSGRDITAIINTLYDKRSMLRGDPTSITGRASSSDVLNELKSEFTKIAELAYTKKVIKDVDRKTESG